MKVDKITPAILNNWLSDERKKYDTLNDGEIGGFHVRANQASTIGKRASASYRIKYRVKGKPHTASLGKVESIKMKRVRDLASDVRAQAKLGIDILEDRKQDRIKTQKKPIIKKLPTLQQWFETKHHDRLYNEGKKTRINYFKRWLKLIGNKELPEVDIADIALNLREYGPKVNKESSDKKHMEYFKELASAYAAENRCSNPLANTKWSAYLKISGLTYSDNEDEGDSRTAIDESVFRKIIKSLEGIIIDDPNNTSPYALLFMAYTGMRQGDIVSLKWSQIRIEDPSHLHIQKVLLKTKKTKSAASTVPISPQAKEILDRVKSISGGNYVFSETTNAKIAAGLTSTWWKKVRIDIGIQFPPYQLRHNIAHKILRSIEHNGCGGNISDVASALGNTVEMCVKSYLNNDSRHTAKVLMAMNL